MKNDRFYIREEPVIGRLGGVVTLPSGFDKTKEKLPMIVFLHGAGESGDSSETSLSRVCVHGIPKYFSKDPDHLGLRVITLSPQCADGLIWDQITLQLMDYIRSAAEEFGADEARISLTGLSMGGYGTWNLLTTYPDFFWRAAPVCGGGVAWRVNDRLKGKPIRAFHSVDDDSVLFECGAVMVRAAQAAGADISFTTYCGEGHGCWDRAYEEGDLIPWLAGAAALPRNEK